MAETESISRTREAGAHPPAPADCGLSDAIRQLTSGSHLLNSLQLIIDTHAIVSVTDRTGTIIYANDRFCEVSQYSREELIGHTHRILKSGYHPESFYEDLWATISSGNTWSGDIQNRAKDGSLYWVQSTISPIFDARNEIVGYGSIRTDVTEQRRLVAELQDNERKALETLQNAIDAIDSAVIITDHSGKIILSNKAQGDMYPELAEVKQPGNYVSDVIRTRKPDLAETEIQRLAAEKISRPSREHRRLADGRMVQITRTIPRNGGMISLHTDISDFIRQQELLKKQALSMDLMNAIAVAANESADINQAFANCLERICRFTGWEVGHVYMPDDDGSGKSHPAGCWYCADEQKFGSFREATEKTECDLGVGLPGRVFEKGDPVWLRDVSVDPNFPRAEAAKRCGIRGGVAFPVNIRNEIVAVLEFYSTLPIEPSSQLAEILSHVCAQMSRVVERVRSEKELMSRVAEELRRRDRELVEQNERFDAALKNMTQGLCMFDSEQRLIVCNQRYAEMYDLPLEIVKPGITLREILEHRIAKGIYAGANPEEYIRERMAWVTSGKRASKVQELSDGRIIAITHQPMSDGGWVTTHEDITERRKAEDINLRLGRIVEDSINEIYIFDAKTLKFLQVNASGCRNLGYTMEELSQLTPLDLKPHVSKEDFERMLAPLRSGEKDHLRFETVHQRKDGTRYDAEILLQQIHSEDRPVFAAIIEDITEHKRAQEALQESQELFSKAFHASPIAFGISDPSDGTHYDVNETWIAMMGYSREEAITHSAYELGIWVDSDDRRRFVEKINGDGHVRGFETRFRTKYGEELDVLVYGENVEIGGESRLLVVTYDITSRKRAEEALRESENRFKRLVETTNVIPWELDLDTWRFTYVGPQAVAVFGYSLEDWYEEGFWVNTIYPDDRDETVNACMAATARGEDHDFEYRIMTADGEVVWVRDVVSVVTENGQPKALRGVLIDVSDRKRAEEALLASQQRFKDIAEVSSDWIWECDENLRFTYLSKRFTQVTGVPAERILGKTRHEVGQDANAAWDAHMADLKARRPFRDFRHSYTTEDGKVQHWSISGRPVFDASGRFTGYRGTGTDRTVEVVAEAELIRHRDHLQELVNEATAELKAKAEELRQALAKEKELNELQRQFVSMASHEFRTPLAIIDSTAQRLMRRAGRLGSEEAEARIEKIRNAVKRMTQLMESTLAAARIQDGKPTIETVACDIAAKIREVCTREQEIARDHIISFELNDLPDTIQADPNALEQVLTNLLSNAVKYAPGAPDIQVHARTEGNDVVIAVRDYGLGIDEDDLPRMFERFFRARTSTGIAGTGIGLNLVKTLVELHDGSITVDSKKGEGSVFTVRLPVKGPANQQGSDSQAA